MLNKIKIREIIAWMTLAIAFILFSVTIAFAQNKTVNVNNDNGKVHIKISKTENGKTVNIDTTFDATDDMNLDKIVSELSGNDDDNETGINNDHGKSHVRVYSDNSGKNKKKSNFKIDVPEMTDAEKEKLHKDIEKAMKGLDKNLEQMKESLQNMHIDFNGFDNHDFHFNFDMDSDNFNNCMKKGYSYSYSIDGDSEADSLNDDEHVIIVGKGTENPPVLEKTITTKKGNKVFIYKRSGTPDKSKSSKISTEEKKKETIPGLSDLAYFPNPTDGKFTLTFEYEKTSDITVKVLDNNSREVFSDKLKNFSGEYSKEIDLSGKSKGSYIIKIIAGEKSITKKIVLN
jgi:hypothetical protein